jgi:hypothetical protein
MILNGKNPDLQEAIKNAERINEHHCTSGPYPCCGHDFWEQVKNMEFGDVIMCNRCHTYYAKIKHLPWLIKEKKYPTFTVPPKTYHQTDVWMAPIPARVS